MLALRGDPDYVPTKSQILELAKDMYPDDKQRQNWIMQRMIIKAVREYGADAVLIGEAFMKSDNIAELFKIFRGMI